MNRETDPMPDGRGFSPYSRPSRKTVVGLVVAFLVVVLLRHDFWNWSSYKPLLFGFLPVGLWWQGMVSILAAVMMSLMVRFAWPQHLEQGGDEARESPHGRE